MRAAVRPLLLILLLSAFTAVAHSQPDSRREFIDGGINYLGWGQGSPSSFTAGGVNVAVDYTTTAGYTCTSIVIRAIDETTGATLDTLSLIDPTSPAIGSFAGLGTGREVQVTAVATFQNGGQFDVAQISATVRTH